MPVTNSVPTEVILSVLLMPVSFRSVTNGAAGDSVSNSKTNVVAGELFPATSVTRTSTVFWPWAGVNGDGSQRPLSAL